jgi:hypothetical protein
MTGANAVSDARDQRQDMLDHTRETVQVNRFEGFDKQNDFRGVRRFDFSAVSIMATMSATGQSLSVMPAAIAGLMRSALHAKFGHPHGGTFMFGCPGQAR